MVKNSQELPLRLLFLIADGFPTHRSDVKVLFGREMLKHGIESDIVAQVAPDTAWAAAIALSWPAGQVLLSPRSGNPFKDQINGLKHDFHVLRCVDPDRYSAVQVRDKVFAGWLAARWARRFKKPFFFWMSYPMSEGSIAIVREQGLSIGLARWIFLSVKGYFGRWLLYRSVLPHADHIFAQSDRMVDELAARGFPRSRMSAVPMGVDFEHPALKEPLEAPTSARINDVDLTGRRVIAHLGVLNRARRPDFLFEMLAEVRRKCPEACLMLIGDCAEPEDRAFFERRAAQCGVADAVFWTGWLPMEQGWARARQAQVAVSLFPRGELLDSASPTKVVEYLALGLPVVANDQPDQHRVLTESGAGTSVAMDVSAFARAVLDVLEQPARAEAMRRAGPPYVQAHRSYALIGERVAQAYRSICRP